MEPAKVDAPLENSQNRLTLFDSDYINTLMKALSKRELTSLLTEITSFSATELKRLRVCPEWFLLGWRPREASEHQADQGEA